MVHDLKFVLQNDLLMHRSRHPPVSNSQWYWDRGATAAFH